MKFGIILITVILIVSNVKSAAVKPEVIQLQSPPEVKPKVTPDRTTPDTTPPPPQVTQLQPPPPAPEGTPVEVEGGKPHPPVWQPKRKTEWRIECPCGMISMWFGELKNIPEGYILCDGSHGVPDLTDKFIIGAGGDKELGDHGGSKYITKYNLPAHKHEVKLYTTIKGGAHSHGFYGTTYKAGDHKHEAGYLKVGIENKHTHYIPAQYTEKDGKHKHKMNAFNDETAHTALSDVISGVVAENIVDKNKPLSGFKNDIHEYTELDYGHKHKIPKQETYPGKPHTHDLTGYTAKNDKHEHSFYGKTNKDGEHTHKVFGYTEETGKGYPYYPPYYAVYFICCVGDEKQYYEPPHDGKY